MAIYSAELYKEKTQLEELITAEIKNRIIDLDLIDTGALYASIKTTITLTDNGYTTDVKGKDYFKYVDGNYGLIDYVLGLQKVSKAATNLYAGLIIDSF